MPGGPHSLVRILQNAVASGGQIVAEVARCGGGLFGSAPLFGAAVALGLISLAPEQRRPVFIILSINIFFLLLSLFYVSTHPADVFLRLWIPTVAILYGLAAQSWAWAARLGWQGWREYRHEAGGGEENRWRLLWPLALAAWLTGFAGQMSFRGGELLLATIRYMQDRQPLELSPRQPELLLNLARPGDKVFYNSIILMPFYFLHGAARLGAVYYHPSFRGSAETSAWLKLPELRFAVLYNPLVYHPSFTGRWETDWWINSPNFNFSPLNVPRTHGPLAKDGELAAADFSWLEVEPKTRDFPRQLKIKLVNPGGEAALELIPVGSDRALLPSGKLRTAVPARWSGWITLELPAGSGVRRFRLAFPPGRPPLRIQGLVFGEDPRLWPWAQKASLTLKPRGEPEEITVSFDPADHLPEPLGRKEVKVLDDQGSSVLLQLRP